MSRLITTAAAAFLVSRAAAATVAPPGARASALYHARRSGPRAAPSPYVYETRYFQADVDHFNFFGPGSTATYAERYLINDTWWGGPGAFSQHRSARTRCCSA